MPKISNHIEDELDELTEEIRESLNQTFSEMLSTFVPFIPSRDEEDELELRTTNDIVEMVEPMLTIDRNTVVHLMNRSGYHIRYEANGWAWMMKRK